MNISGYFRVPDHQHRCYEMIFKLNIFKIIKSSMVSFIQTQKETPIVLLNFLVPQRGGPHEETQKILESFRIKWFDDACWVFKWGATSFQEVQNCELAHMALERVVLGTGQRSIGSVEVRGSRFEVRGSRSEVRGPISEVRDPRSEVRGPRSEIRGSRSEVRGSRSKVRGPISEVRGSRVRSARFEVRGGPRSEV